MFIVLEGEMITLVVFQNYDSNISRQLLNSFKTLTILSIFWSSAPLVEEQLCHSLMIIITVVLLDNIDLNLCTKIHFYSDKHCFFIKFKLFVIHFSSSVFS